MTLFVLSIFYSLLPKKELKKIIPQKKNSKLKKKKKIESKKQFIKKKSWVEIFFSSEKKNKRKTFFFCLIKYKYKNSHWKFFYVIHKFFTVTGS